MCNCSSLSECTAALPTREIFIANFNKLGDSTKLWVELFVCNDCGQHWIIEEGGPMDRRADMAFKISDSKNWLNYDMSSALSEWLITQHGGLSDIQCSYSGCENKALANMVVCVKHGHSEHQWSDTT